MHAVTGFDGKESGNVFGVIFPEVLVWGGLGVLPLESAT